MGKKIGKINDLDIVMFSQQNGDCIHLNINKSLGILIDTGKSNNYERIKDELQKANKKVNYIFITHNHSDHTGGLLKFLDDNRNQVKGVIKWIDKNMILDFESINAINKINDFTKQNKIIYFNVTSIDEFNSLNSNIQILYPNKSHRYSKNLNKNSIIISFKIGDKYILFTGDATKVEENKITKIPKYKQILENIIVIKLGHHGSETSSRESYIKKIATKNLKAVLCSCRDDWGKRPPHDIHIKYIEKIVCSQSKDCKFYFTGETEIINTGETEMKNRDIHIHCENKSGTVEVNVSESGL